MPSNLYYGQNGRNQHVLTWKATETAHDFHGDISPLIQEILHANKPNYPNEADYLGYFSFGSEAYHSKSPVSFHVPLLSIDIRK